MSRPVIEIKNFSKSFGDTKAVDDFSMDVSQGEIFAFLGSNGSGKTTTIRCLLGIYMADEGELLIKGQKYTSDMNALVGYLPEERGLYTKAKIMDLFIYFGNLRGYQSKYIKKLATEYLEKVGLQDHIDKQISQLSSGMQQKVQIGVTILYKPEILILDEPFKGLDPVNRQLFLDIFRELREAGSTILYSTHVVDEAQKVADRVVMIKSGKRILYGTVDEVRSSQGENTIHVNYKGKLVENPQMFTARIENKTAELTPVNGVTANEIIKFLVNSDVEMSEFMIDRPSLNEIFIRLAK